MKSRTARTGGAELFAVTLKYAFDSDMRQLRGIFKSVVMPNGTTLPTVIGLDGRRR